MTGMEERGSTNAKGWPFFVPFLSKEKGENYSDVELLFINLRKGGDVLWN
ncbi:hypothetical protein [Brevibacillus porteri]